MDANEMWGKANTRGLSYEKKVKMIRTQGQEALVQFSAAIKKKDTGAAKAAEMKLISMLHGSQAKAAPKPAKAPAMMRANTATGSTDTRVPLLMGLLNTYANTLPPLVKAIEAKRGQESIRLLGIIQEETQRVLKALPPPPEPVEPPQHAEHGPTMPTATEKDFSSGMQNAYSPEM